jgi:hypothetical protein
MPKSLSNRQALEKALLDIATEYLAKPSGLLYEFEQFLMQQGITTKKYEKKRDKTIEFPPGQWRYELPKAWEVRGFKSEKEMKEFEARPDFPGWTEL